MRTAVLIVGEVARDQRDSGARQRASTIVGLVKKHFDEVRVIGPRSVFSLRGPLDLLVGVSWPSLVALAMSQQRASLVWFDACDSARMLASSPVTRGRIRNALAQMRDKVAIPRVAPKIVTYISEDDAEVDADLWGLEPLVIPGTWPAYEPLPSTGSHRRLVFAGDGRYGPNREAVAWLTGTLLPELRVRGCQMPLEIFGHGHDSARMNGAIYNGYVADPRHLYRQGDIHLAPVRSGAGTKSKVAIPMMAGLEVITTPEGAQGLIPTQLTTVTTLVNFADVVCSAAFRPAPRPQPVDRRLIVARDDSDRLNQILSRNQSSQDQHQTSIPLLDPED